MNSVKDMTMDENLKKLNKRREELSKELNSISDEIQKIENKELLAPVKHIEKFIKEISKKYGGKLNPEMGTDHEKMIKVSKDAEALKRNAKIAIREFHY